MIPTNCNIIEYAKRSKKKRRIVPADGSEEQGIDRKGFMKYCKDIYIKYLPTALSEGVVILSSVKASYFFLIALMRFPFAHFRRNAQTKKTVGRVRFWLRMKFL